MNIRKEKDVIRNNRITREKQYEEQRLRVLEEALHREAVSNGLSLCVSISCTKSGHQIWSSNNNRVGGSIF